MEKFIKISAIWYDAEEDFYEYRFEVSNGLASIVIDSYGNQEQFFDFGQSLKDFPKNADHTEEIEFGTSYILLKVFCFAPNGDTAIHIVAENSGEAPYFYKSDFYIDTKPYAINNLGNCLCNWNPKIQKEIIWKAE